VELMRGGGGCAGSHWLCASLAIEPKQTLELCLLSLPMSLLFNSGLSGSFLSFPFISGYFQTFPLIPGNFRSFLAFSNHHFGFSEGVQYVVYDNDF